MTIEPGLVSTIIPVFNRPRLLREAVSSVLAQTYRPIEVIIVDDGSSDDTAAVADGLAREHSEEVVVVHGANRGPGLARESGRALARGEFIQYLDSDDLLMPDKFERQVAALRAAPGCGACYGWTRFRHADSRLEAQPWKRSGERVETMFPSFLMSRWWDTPTPLYRRRVTDAAGPWSDLRLEEDWEYDCRIAALGTRLCQVEAFVAEVRDHHDHRLSRGGALERARLAERARSHEMILGHALRAGIDADQPEMRHFARELFLLCRQCGAAGLRRESQELFARAREVSGRGAGGYDYRLYRTAATLLGWRAAARLALFSDRLRR